MVKEIDTQDIVECECKCQCQSENVCSLYCTLKSLELEPIHIRTKVKRTSSKKYKRKQMAIAHLYQGPLIMKFNYIVFGYQYIESNYKFYKDFIESSIEDHVQEQLFVNNVVQVKDNGFYQMSLSNIRSSGIKDFNFLINLYQSQPDNLYKKLGDSLFNYQQSVNSHLIHLREIQKQIRRGLINVEKQIYPVIESAKTYFQEYLKQNYSQKYIRFSIFHSDFKQLDISLSSHGFTDKFAEMAGINLLNAGDYLIAKIGNLYGNSDERLHLQTEKLDMFAFDNKKSNVPITFYTNDGIQITTTVNFYNIYLPNMPDFLDKLDAVMYVWEFNITNQQIESLQQQRNHINQVLVQKQQTNKNISFEQLVLSEMFMEKYYSNHIPHYINYYEHNKQAKFRSILES